MGRHEYLSRLALGRSPFESVDRRNDGVGMQAEDGEFSEPEGNAQSVNEAQQYNAKGRPINPTTDLRNAEMRKAQNSVLELVGVVERRERSEYSNEMKFRYIHHARQTVLAAEHETGEGIESLIQLLIAPLTTWWSDCLIQRCLIGLYTAKEPFASVVSSMWQTLRTGGLKGTYSILFPGLIPYMAYVIARMFSEALAEDVIRRMSERVLRQALPIRHRKWMLHVLELIEAGLRLLIDGALLPLIYYATAQQIGVAPALPLLPPLRYHLPWSPYSFHAFGWKPLLGLPLLRSVSSPATLILGQTLLHIESEEGIISSTDLTNFRRPSFGELPEVPKTPTIKDPLGWILFQTYRLRRKAVEWCGWTIVPSSNVQNLNTKHEIDVLVGNEDGTDGGVRRHRSTALARLPAQHLAAHIDSFLERLVLLPFECLVLRAVAVSYSNSPLPKTLEALAATPMLPRPFAGWMDQALHSHSAITSTSAQINKVGLALILRLAMGTLLCTGVAKGICWFDRMNRVQEGLQREGKSCYRRGDYKTAIGHFDRAIGRATSVQLLDNRAACHEKLNDLPAALKDAKRAIQFQNEDPTGYLRAGKVLVKMDKQSVALEIYAHGLKKVKHIGQGYELLRKMHGELTTQLAPPTSIDPLTVLPRELAELILGYLSFQQRIAISRVSKQWMDFVRSSPNLWQHLDLSNPKRKVKTAFISKAINTARQKLTSATLSSLHDFDKVLEGLEWFDLELPIESAHQLMLPSKLVHLRFVSTINNATANFFKDSDGSVRGFSLPQLQSLEVAVPWMDIALIDLFLTGDPESRSAAPTETPVAPSKLKQLNLHTLSVSSVDLTTFLSNPRLEQLSEFGLRPSSICDDNITEVIIDKLPRLHTVDVSGTDITGVGVKKLLRNSNLKTLVVNDCRYLGSDAVAWAREHGVKVAYKMSSSETGGKKVRY
ncbi:hypothetical protein KC354_g5733 [Hortaea werneckii]|nr:hypothetical protein KC354_g5733 [Hortaea werneckii]